MATSPPPSDASGRRWQGAPSPRAQAVEVSFWLWVAYLTLDAIVVLVLGLGATAAAAAIDEGVVQQQIARMMVTLLVNAVLLGFAVLMRLGRNWARIVLAVFGGLRLLFGLSVLIASGNPISTVLFLLVAAAVTTMFLPAANAWFVPRQRES